MKTTPAKCTIAAMVLFCLALPLSCCAGIVERYGDWTIDPFIPGFGLPEPHTLSVYGTDLPGEGMAQFPDYTAVTGTVTIPVFLVDWSDFDPTTDLSNKDNPSSTFPGYIQGDPTNLQAYLNASNGVAGYFNEVSGGKLVVQFQVFPWLVSSNSNYLADKEPTYYKTNIFGIWYADKDQLAEDVLRAAVAELGLNMADFDADGNLYLDGFVIVYEGKSGEVSGTNLSWINGAWNATPSYSPQMNNIKELVATSDVNYALFEPQNILYNRYCNIPEQITPDGPENPGTFNTTACWAHEIGHLLLGYRDYYLSPFSLGNYALSAKHGSPTPFHPSAFEKWMFGKWIDAPVISNAEYCVLHNHHLRADETYDTNLMYICRILINNDTNHYLTLENRCFVPASEGGSLFNEEDPGKHPESGIVVFEVNHYLTTSEQVKRLMPIRCEGESTTTDIGAFQEGDVLDYVTNGFHVSVGGFSAPGTNVQFEIGTFLDVTQQNGNCCIMFRPVTNLNHEVQFTTNLPGGWTNLPGEPHNSGSVIDTNAAGSIHRFYRLIIHNM